MSLPYLGQSVNFHLFSVIKSVAMSLVSVCEDICSSALVNIVKLSFELLHHFTIPVGICVFNLASILYY